MKAHKNLFRFHMLLFFLLIVLNQNFLSAAINQHSDIQGNVKMANSKRCVLFDENHTRMTLAKSNEGKGYNWLFLAGGPGADSEYFNELIDLLDLPGNVWLIDLPENGGNRLGTEYNGDYDFNRLWESSLKKVLKSLNNVILVGHSFSGLYPLLFPEIENDCQQPRKRPIWRSPKMTHLAVTQNDPPRVHLKRPTGLPPSMVKV